MTSKQTKQSKQAGFSIIELLVVVGIMLLLISAFIPSVISSLQSGAESTATRNLKSFATAEIAYSQMYPAIGFSVSAANLGTKAASCPTTPDPAGAGACLIPDADAALLDSGIISGYSYAYNPKPSGCGTAGTPCTGFVLLALPSNGGGRKAYCLDATGNIVYQVGSAIVALGNSCPLTSSTIKLLGQ